MDADPILAPQKKAGPEAPAFTSSAWRSVSLQRNMAAVLSLGQNRSCRGLVIFVPGFTDGLLGVSYVGSLAAAANASGFALQPTLSSSYGGYGTSSLDKDVDELDSLIGCRRIQGLLPSKRNIVIIGHSTGCQDAVHYVKHGMHRERVV